MKNNKTDKVTVRFTPEEKEILKEYADSFSMTLSEVIRGLCSELFRKKESLK